MSTARERLRGWANGIQRFYSEWNARSDAFEVLAELEAAEKERDELRASAIQALGSAADACNAMERERDEWKARAERAERELSDAFDLPGTIGPAEGEAKRIVYELRAEVARLRGLIDRDRTGLAAALAKIVREVRSRGWLLEGRGPYEWDDDRYKDEAGQAMRNVLVLAEEALRESGRIADSAFSGKGTP